MRQISALMLLGAALGIMAPLGAAGRVEPVQAQNQAPPPEGFRIIGNIYWVGGEYGSYLITTPQGHILHDTGTNEMHDVIVSNVKKLGFDVKDIKVMISSHAHFDHVQGHAAMKKLTGAQVIALGGDAAALEAGQDNSAGGFRGLVAVHVDRVIKDGDTVSLGGVTLRALWVPGHTQGATVWMTTVSEGGKNYSVAFRGGETPNAGVQLIGNPRHPKVIEDTKMTLQDEGAPASRPLPSQSPAEPRPSVEPGASRQSALRHVHGRRGVQGDGCERRKVIRRKSP